MGTVPVLVNKKTKEKVAISPYPHRHVIPILHQQGGVFIPFTRKKIDGLFLEKIKMAEERKKNAS